MDFILITSNAEIVILSIWNAMKIIKLIGWVLTELLFTWYIQDWSDRWAEILSSNILFSIPTTHWNSTAESHKPRCKCLLLVVWPWVYYLISLNLSIYICQKKKVVPTEEIRWLRVNIKQKISTKPKIILPLTSIPHLQDFKSGSFH